MAGASFSLFSYSLGQGGRGPWGGDQIRMTHSVSLVASLRQSKDSPTSGRRRRPPPRTHSGTRCILSSISLMTPLPAGGGAVRPHGHTATRTTHGDYGAHCLLCCAFLTEESASWRESHAYSCPISPPRSREVMRMSCGDQSREIRHVLPQAEPSSCDSRELPGERLRKIAPPAHSAPRSIYPRHSSRPWARYRNFACGRRPF